MSGSWCWSDSRCAAPPLRPDPTDPPTQSWAPTDTTSRGQGNPMTTRTRPRIAAAAALLMLVSTTAACGSSGGHDGGGKTKLTKVKLQLQWYTQAQFAGYLAAVKQGFYKEAGSRRLDPEGGGDIVPQTRARAGPCRLRDRLGARRRCQSREQGAEDHRCRAGVPALRDAAGVVQGQGHHAPRPTSRARRSATGASATSTSCSPGMTKAGPRPRQGRQDRAAAVRHEGVCSAVTSTRRRRWSTTSTRRCSRRRTRRPASSTSPADFNAINWNDDGTAMLQDAIWANTEKLKDKKYQDTTVKFLTASYEGWIYCRDPCDGVPRHRGAGGVQARCKPSALADERDQQADLAVAQRHRHGRPDCVEADRDGGEQDQERRG